MNIQYESIKCECGHFCPIEFAISNEDGNWTCPNCYIQEMTLRVKISKYNPKIIVE